MKKVAETLSLFQFRKQAIFFSFKLPNKSFSSLKIIYILYFKRKDKEGTTVFVFSVIRVFRNKKFYLLFKNILKTNKKIQKIASETLKKGSKLLICVGTKL